MAPVHGLLPRNFVIGGVLIENMIVALKIHQTVGVIDPATGGTIMVL
jgi:hypothetical protein